MKLSEGVKDRLGFVVGVVQTGFHWGFVPLVLYLGKLRFMFFVIYTRLGRRSSGVISNGPTLILTNSHFRRIYEGS